MMNYIKNHLLSFLIGVLASLGATLLFEHLWGFPSGLFRKPISFYLIDMQGNPVKENIKAYLTVYPPMTNNEGIISLDFDEFPKNHGALLHIESDEGEIPLIDYPIQLDLEDLTKPIRIVISPKKKTQAQVIDCNDNCIVDYSFLTTTRNK